MRLRVQITHRNLGKEGGSHSIPHAPSGALTDLAGGRREERWPPRPQSLCRYRPSCSPDVRVLRTLASDIWS